MIEAIAHRNDEPDKESPQRANLALPGQPGKSIKASQPAVRFFWAFAAILMMLYGAELWLHALHTSVTYDEPVFVYSGYHFWKCGDHGINPENPPLLEIVSAIPLRNERLAGPEPLCPSTATTKFNEYVDAMEFLVANRAQPVVTQARMAATVFSFSLAVTMLFAIRRLFGDAEALVALALLAFEPNMIAHGSLATTDMAATVSFFAGVFALYAYCNRPSIWRSIWLGLTIGAMLTTKHSGAAAVIFLWILLFVMAWRSSTKELPGFTAFLRHARAGVLGLGAATVIGVVCLWGSYGFHFYAIPKAHQQTLPTTALEPGTGGVPAMISTVTNWGRDWRILPEPYLFGITDVIRQTVNHPAFILGGTQPHGVWYYFPVAFIIKTSIPLLVMLLLGLSYFIGFREHSREFLFLLVPALCYFGFTLTSGLNIGVRHILPIYPFLIGIAAAGSCAAARHFPKAWILIFGLLAFAGVDSARTFPNYIAFSNEFWGGTDETYKYLSDSNVDWGQTLPQIKTYLTEHHVNECWIAAAGTPDIALATLPCHLLPARYQWMRHPQQDLPTNISGTVFLSNETLPAEYPGVYDSIVKNAKPVALIGGATFVYQGTFDVTPAALLVHTLNSSYYYRHGPLTNAIDEMNAAIAIDPGDPRSHFALGMYLQVAGKGEAAREEFEHCIVITGGDPALAQLRDLARQEINKPQ